MYQHSGITWINISTNRTILELKLANKVYQLTRETYQSHHTGIEMNLKNLNQSKIKTTNRTILELKLLLQYQSYQYLHLPIAPYWNWNMLSNQESCQGDILPIAPYWNWNWHKNWAPAGWAAYQSHHTGIEICCLRRQRQGRGSTNRTILELKCGIFIKIITQTNTTNRTILELKSHERSKSSISTNLPIAPYWNWNRNAIITVTNKGTLPIAPYWNWNVNVHYIRS